VDVLGVPVTLVDTAGARAALDAIEAEGVERAEHARSIAELVVVILDGAAPIVADDRRLLDETAGRPRLIVVNKIDLPRAWPVDELCEPGSPEAGIRPLEVSARTGEGLEALRAAIVGDVLERQADRDLPSISNLRHVALVDASVAALDRMHDAVEAGATEEMLLVDLGEARAALEEIRGRRAPEDLLRHIFGRFCIGK
jgi:tRNA modification GTPase